MLVHDIAIRWLQYVKGFGRAVVRDNRTPERKFFLFLLLITNLRGNLS